jgi:S-DNA-T family DNA segregation ATPase FtsK/SpoIIIE
MAGKVNRIREEVVLEVTETKPQQEAEEKPRSAKKEKDKEKEKVKEQEKKSRTKIHNAPNIVTRVSSFLGDRQFHKFSGMFLMLISVFMLISFFSFFFTWRIDHDKVSGPLFELLTSSNVRVENWMGKFGAIASHYFIQRWFGIAAFALPFIAFLGGFRILFKMDLLPFGKTLRYTFFGFVFTASLLGYVFYSNGSMLFTAGAFGYAINTWMLSTLGNLGTGLTIGFAGIAFAVITFGIEFRLPKFPEKTEPNTIEDPELDVKTTNVEEPVLATNKLREQLEATEAIELDAEETEEDKEDESFVDSFPAMEVQNETELSLEPTLITAESESEEPSGVELSIESVALPEDSTESDDIPQTEVLGEYDPKLDLSSYRFPTIDLLENHGSNKNQLSMDELKAELEMNKNRIVETLKNYNIAIEKIKATVGPTVTLFEIIPQAGVRISKIKNLEDDIALSLSALGIRIIAPIPGKGTIGIEVPNQNPEVVSMRSVMSSEKFQNCEFDLPIGLGKTISNEVFVADLAKMPHLLMAGATGQGKSVGLNAVLVSLLYKKHPSQVKFVLVDPKKVELTLFKTIERHFLAKLPGEEDAIITDTRKVVNTLNSLCIEMDQRYELLKDAAVRNIREYNAKFVSRRLNPNNGHRFLPFIVLVIDEFADLIMTAGKEVETPIARLAQLARAIGIHLIIATQRPSVNIITGTIKANFPARLAFRVTSKIDSRTILDAGGAEQLIGRGDMLLSTGADLIRLQCAFVDTPEVDSITEFIGSQRGYPDAFLLPEYVGEGDAGGAGELDASDRDPLFEEAARMVVQHQQGSASLLQRRLKLGYNRAGRLIDQLEAAGVIGPFEGSKAREVKIKDPVSLEQFLSSGK